MPLLPFAVITRSSASSPPQEKIIGLNPDFLVRVEAAEDDPETCLLHVEGGSKPYRIAAPAEAVMHYVNDYYAGEDGEKPAEDLVPTPDSAAMATSPEHPIYPTVTIER
jgi:hypothetical protein